MELQGNETKKLSTWFDQLWSIASTLTVKQLADVQSQTAALRREFMKLKQNVKRKVRDPKAQKSKVVLSDSLEQLLTNAARFFVCNSDRVQGDRTPTGGFVLEEEMHNRGFATAWEDFKFPSHMEKVGPGDVIYMFAKGVGIIGIGMATGSYEKLVPGQDGRVSHVHETNEWRVPTQWLVWTDKAGAFHCKSPNRSLFTFWNVTESQYDDFRADVATHFLGDA